MATEHLIDLERQEWRGGRFRRGDSFLGQSRYRNAASADAGQTGGAWPATQGLAPAGMPRPAVAFSEEHTMQ
jgi:hypothetical protein